MADFFDELSEAHRAMIARQPVFFAATAAEGGRINVSPKGYDSRPGASPGSTSRARATRPMPTFSLMVESP
jgi:predicted pyridoxine 5'-phosphate oxidase superfamily flavin-nucleotide-binding protein